MELEFNPFALTIGSSVPITTITVLSNLDWFNPITDPLTGDTVTLQIDARQDISAYQVFATGSAQGQPTMRSLLAGHIPNIAISQVTGLQSAINALVKTLASLHASLTVSNNGVGDYTLTPNFGTTSSTFAIGNDSRFPANVTGLRKSAGAGSTDVAALAKTDYWDTTVFVASGGSHARGLVPDPGGSAGTTKYLREDATWVVPPGSGTVTSVALTAPAEFSVGGSPITTTGTIALTKANQNANTFWGGPTTGGPAAPTFRGLVYSDTSPFVGTTSSTLAAGNDTRFPASVTGLRKSSGAGSTDVAAVAGVDFAAATTFGGKGPSHSVGLVPDPGAGAAPFVRYLRDDGTWQPFVPDVGTIANSQLATMNAKTLKANATAGTASPTDVDAKTARSNSLLNLESITTFGNTDYAAVSTDRYIATSATFTATRTVTLPLANSFNAGQPLIISDDFGAINGAFLLNISRQGSDTIQGSSSALVLDIPKGSYTLTSDGVSKWSVTRRSPAIRYITFIANTTYNVPVGVKALFVQCVGGGGGGGAATAAGSQCSVAGGGGGGGCGAKLISSPASSYAITIGAGGAGGSSGTATGSNGGDTLFGGTVSASGGLGGSGLATGTSAAFALGGGGSSASGDYLIDGSEGGTAQRVSGTLGVSGTGGASAFAGQQRGQIVEADGRAGKTFGGGGSGAQSTSVTTKQGGTGGQGIIVVTEYY